MTTFIRLCGGGTGVGTTRDECPHRLHDFPLPDGYGDAAEEAARRLGHGLIIPTGKTPTFLLDGDTE